MLSLTAQYAIRSVMHIARVERWYTADEIATAASIPRGYVAKVLQLLTVAGLLVSQRGLNGGFRINPAAKPLTAFDIVHAIDGTESFGSCQGCQAGDPTVDCSANRLLAGIQAEVERRLREATLADLIAGCVPTCPAQPT